MRQDPPNILVLLPDQWRADGLSWLGHSVVDTPCIDQIASEGTTFTRAYSNCPVCIPARACLMTGQSPNTVGRFGYRDGIRWNYDPSLVTVLRNAGYQTMLSGKTHFSPPRLHLGFEQMALYDNQRHHPGFTSDYDDWLARQTGGQVLDTAQTLDSNSMIVEPWSHGEHLHPSTWTVTAAIDMLERRDPARPFFLSMNFHRPHPPIDPPIEYWQRLEGVEMPPPVVGDWIDERYRERAVRINPSCGTLPPGRLERARRGYFAQLMHLDFQIGRLMRWLQLRGMGDNLLVVFSSDHGEQLGDHHLYRKSTPMRGSLDIPMIVRPPKGTAHTAGQRCDRPTALYDILPTCLDYAGVPIPDNVEAKSLAPLVSNPTSPWREVVHTEQVDGVMGPWQCLCDGRHKYIWITTTGQEFYFDLVADPDECHNLAADPKHAGELEPWRSRLAEVLGGRPEDGFVKDGQLVPGNKTPLFRDRLLGDG
ncbi:MAG: arylsulfatase [Planctomycetota bacterium]